VYYITFRSGEDLTHHVAVDGQPAGEDSVGPGADIRLGLVVVDALLQAVLDRGQVFAALGGELGDHGALVKSLLLREQLKLLQEALDEAAGAPVGGKLVVQVLLVDVVRHVVVLTALLERLLCVGVVLQQELGRSLQNKARLRSYLHQQGQPLGSDLGHQKRGNGCDQQEGLGLHFWLGRGLKCECADGLATKSRQDFPLSYMLSLAGPHEFLGLDQIVDWSWPQYNYVNCLAKVAFK